MGSFQKQVKRTIDKDGISTFGYQRAGNLSSDEREKHGQYKNQAEWAPTRAFEVIMKGCPKSKLGT
ncbi:hypothetical protein J21TS7_26970 [Paenibacillus cineris]|uniref:Uncharacterized protein n=1 Tax=Paenibacillus cineris TaxID=237530 RepID=A0ABQ4LCU3_9BACL|nr:hypothetical protein J21TS7_26970 [Paenibacillus cineris]